jgi:hypothetical protein
MQGYGIYDVINDTTDMKTLLSFRSQPVFDLYRIFFHGTLSAINIFHMTV